jgi:hypothetical protein
MQRGGIWRHFFVALSMLYVLLALVGFIPSYFIGPPVPVLADVHGVLMLAWLALFCTQVRLVFSGNLQAHRRFGVLGMSLAAVIWASMLLLTITSMLRYKPELDSYLYDVLLVEIGLLLLFPVFVVWGLLARHRPEEHRRLMAIATLMLVQAGLDRMHWQPLPGPMLVWILLIPFFLFDLFTRRRVHFVTVTATMLIVAYHVAVILLWGWPAWHQFWFGVVHRVA